ncbi:MAG TPA: S8 family serine peptidase [Geminicoccaceae bacterium]|nr:S8 family serine peptidase [Geminicoccaceae bacterium]
MGPSRVRSWGARWSVVAAAALLLAAPAGAVELGARPPEHRPPLLAHGKAAATPAADRRAAEMLASLASQRGRLPVIVELAEDEAEADPGIRRGRQRAFLDRVGGGGAAPVLFQSLPFVSLQADPLTLRRILADPQVVSVQEDAIHRPALVQSTDRIDAEKAWASPLNLTGAGQVVAVLDTGADKNHPMLLGKVVSEACYSSNVSGQTTSLCPGGGTSSTAVGSGVNCSISSCFHGTHVASIAVGQSAATTPGSGVAPGAQLVSIQVFSRSNSGPVAWTSDIIRGLERVLVLVPVLAQDGVKIAAVNLSLGGGGYSGTCDSVQPALTTAIKNLRAAGVATVVAAGNNGWTGKISSPACIGDAIAVGSTGDTTDAVSSFSNLSTTVDVMAPGQSITAAVPGTGYGTYNGTSMATPHVAGAWALLREARPGASVAQIESALETSGVMVARRNVRAPRIDVDNALLALGPGS